MISAQHLLRTLVLTVLVFATLGSLTEEKIDSPVQAHYTTDYVLKSVNSGDSDSSVKNKLNLIEEDDQEMVDPHCGWHIKYKWVYFDDGTTSWWERIAHKVWKC